jgi:hypothetical protein
MFHERLVLAQAEMQTAHSDRAPLPFLMVDPNQPAFAKVKLFQAGVQSCHAIDLSQPGSLRKNWRCFTRVYSEHIRAPRVAALC